MRIENKAENRFLYACKLIACIFVITIHAPFGGDAGDIEKCIARFAVPFFFAVSGRFLLVGSDGRSLLEAGEIRKKAAGAIKKLFKVIVPVYLAHLVFSFVYYTFHEGFSLKDWFTMKFNLFEAREFLLFNSGRFVYDYSYVFDHLWYVFALIYVYAVVMLLAPVFRKCYKVIALVLLFLLYFGELLQVYYPVRLFGISVSTWYVLRNWLFEGIPFVFLGIWFSDIVQKYGEKVKEYENLAFILIVSGILLTVAECCIFGTSEVYIGSAVTVLGLLHMSECLPDKGGAIAEFGKRASGPVYFYHVLLIAVIDIMFEYGIIPQLLMWQKTIVVIVLSLLLFGAVPMIIKKKLKR